MSLRVWLPLNGSLENKGLDDVTVTNNGAVVDNNGKIGKCYSFGTGNSYMTVDSEPIKHFTEFSFACWVKIISWNSSYATIFAIKNSTSISWNNLIFSLLRNSSSSILCFNIAGSGGQTTSHCHTEELNLNTWYHIAGTYKAGEIRLYQDGVLVSTYETAVIPTFNAIDNFWIGKANANSYQSNILLNDIRIYDHTLSPMEVKQISQGLVLHYPLNHGGLGQENLLKNSHIKYDNNGYYVGTYAFADSSKLETGKTYTLSFNGELQDDSQTGWYFNISPSPYAQIINKTTDKEGRFAFSFTMPENGGSRTNIGCYSIPLGNRLGCAIWNVKLEEGSIATPWSPAPSDDLYSTIGGDDTIEYDCSGYSNNGQYYKYDSTGDYSFVSDTPRYSTAVHIASANPTTKTASGTVYLYGHCGLTTPEQLTIAFWCKPIEGYGGATGQGQFCTTNYEYSNTAVGSDYMGSAVNHRDNGIDINDSESSSHLRPLIAFDENEWHHYVVTYDGKTGIVYKDGQSVSTKAFSEPKTLASFIGVVIGFSKAGGVWRHNDSYYSDFRVYCTALSPEDVLDLYNLGAAIDTNNNLYGTMLEEV